MLAARVLLELLLLTRAASQRDLFIRHGLQLRERFRENMALTDERAVEEVLASGEAALAKFEHPDPCALASCWARPLLRPAAGCCSRC